jgi:stress response protein YsnF
MSCHRRTTQRHHLKMTNWFADISSKYINNGHTIDKESHNYSFSNPVRQTMRQREESHPIEYLRDLAASVVVRKR